VIVEVCAYELVESWDVVIVVEEEGRRDPERFPFPRHSSSSAIAEQALGRNRARGLTCQESGVWKFG
jgi:hypothetical protein